MITVRTSLLYHHGTKKSKVSERMQGKEILYLGKREEKQINNERKEHTVLDAKYHLPCTASIFRASAQVPLYLSGTKKMSSWYGEGTRVQECVSASPAIRKNTFRNNGSILHV